MILGRLQCFYSSLHKCDRKLSGKCLVFSQYIQCLFHIFGLSTVTHAHQCCCICFWYQSRVFSCSLMSRLAVVCGGSRGIGKAVSLLLAGRGCRVAVVSRNEDAARATVASLHGGTTVPCLWHLFIEALLILHRQCKKMLQNTFPLIPL